MLQRTLITLVSLIAVVDATLAQSGDSAKQQHAVIGTAPANAMAPIAKDRARRWFPEAGLGLFIHWGLSSVDGHHELSWGMMANCPWKAPQALTPTAYWKLADQFHPQQYHPEKWLQAAKDAGFGYAVLTTRHHDGYALWPSDYGDFSTKNNLDGRDLVGEYVKACRKVGLKVGLYYSPPDFHFNRQYMSFGYGSKGTPESPHLGLQHEPVQLPDKPAAFADRYLAYVNGQITELMTRYGKIDLLWFDGGAGPKMLSQEKILRPAAGHRHQRSRARPGRLFHRLRVPVAHPAARGLLGVLRRPDGLLGLRARRREGRPRRLGGKPADPLGHVSRLGRQRAG